MPSDDLIQADDYAFAFRRLEPAETPRSLLVLLHGVGGDEHQLDRLAGLAPPGMLVVLPRGHRSISGGQRGWYRVGLGGDAPQIVEEEMIEALDRLVEFLRQLQTHHDIPAERTWVAGFSQGGVLAAAAALTSPGSVAGFVMMSGRLLPELDARIADGARLRHLRALILHGRDDDVLPVDEAEAARERLQALGIPHALRRLPGGHRLAKAMEDTAAAWLRSEASGDAKPEQVS